MLSKNIKRLRKKSKITVREISAFLNVSEQDYLDFENGCSEKLDLEQINNLSDLFNVNLFKLLNEEIKEPDVLKGIGRCSADDLRIVADFFKITKAYEKMKRISEKTAGD